MKLQIIFSLVTIYLGQQIFALSPEMKQSDSIKQIDLTTVLKQSIPSIDHHEDLKEGEVLRIPKIVFNYNSTELLVNDTVNAKDSLNYVFNILTKFPEMIVVVRGHTDCRGNEKYNQTLSYKRAVTCVNYLIQEKGIHDSRLKAKGMGELEPLHSMNCYAISKLKSSEAQERVHQENRRIDIQVLSFDFKK